MKSTRGERRSRMRSTFSGVEAGQAYEFAVLEKGGEFSSLDRSFYIHTGYNFQLANPLFEIKPSIFIKSNGQGSQFDFNAILAYNKRFWGGVSYRPGDAIVGIFGLELFNGVRIGYSYDFIVSKISKYSSGTHELTVGYCFDLSLDKTPQRYKSIRFL